MSSNKTPNPPTTTPTSNEALKTYSRAHEVAEEPVRVTVEWEPQTGKERAALRVVEVLRAEGGEAYFVGGYPRDLAISSMQEVYPDFHFAPHDIDIVTSLHPDRVEAVLTAQGMSNRSFGKQFQVCGAQVMEGDAVYTFEVATYRTEGSYSDGRRPDTTEVTTEVREDIARRDFTINGLLFDPHAKELIDYPGGLADLREGILRFIGNPEDRIAEDALRMLRYVRFRTKYKLGFDQRTAESIRTHATALSSLPGERIKGEMEKLLTLSRGAFAIADLARLRLLQEVLPEVSTLYDVAHTPEGVPATIHREGDVFTHTLKVLRSVARPEFLAMVREVLDTPPNTSDDEAVSLFYERYGSSVAWALLFHDIGKRETQELLPAEQGRNNRFAFHGHEQRSRELVASLTSSGRIPFSNSELEIISFLVEHHLEAHRVCDPAYEIHGAHRRSVWSHPCAEQLLFVGLADLLGNYQTHVTSAQKPELFKNALARVRQFQAHEKELAWIHEHGKGISLCVLQELRNAGALPPHESGSPLIAPLKNMALALLKTNRLTPDMIAHEAHTMVQLLEAEALLHAPPKPTQEGKSRADVRNEHVSALAVWRENVRNTLRAHYSLDPNSVL